jgi:predicted nucleic acid-binding protein
VTAFALDTNILVYAEGVERAPSDRAKISRSQNLVVGLVTIRARIIAPAQVLAELHNVLRVRHRMTRAACSAKIGYWTGLFELVPTGPAVLRDALDIAATAHLQIFDAIILAAAAEAGCDLLVSEDFQDGFRWRGVTVTNPFGPAPDRRLPLG